MLATSRTARLVATNRNMRFMQASLSTAKHRMDAGYIRGDRPAFNRPSISSCVGRRRAFGDKEQAAETGDPLAVAFAQGQTQLVSQTALHPRQARRQFLGADFLGRQTTAQTQEALLGEHGLV